MKRFLFLAAILVTVQVAAAMTGGPMFCVGQRMTSMTVEASRVNWQILSPRTQDGRESVVSERVGLTARYGLAPFLDVGATLGAATMSFSDLPRGYSSISESWRFAWGAGLRLGIPAVAHRFQFLALVNYTGFQPEATTKRGGKEITSKYLWHEITPVAAVGVRLGPIVPYVGVGKPYLIGKRDVTVTMNGVPVPSASGSEDYVDGDQLVRPVVGLEWKLPDGYSLAVEADGNSEGYWTLSVGLAQVLR
ncbi:hypothetical protein KKH27_00655 [bacterium]|nr:hypothetical protein [bacterium]MBU1984141.1 hypothetical protein [bacterium]